MATLALISPCSLCKTTKSTPVPRRLNRVSLTRLHHSPPSTSSTIKSHGRRTTPSTSSSTIKSRGSRTTTIAMSLQMEEAVAATPTVVEVAIPPESLAGFESDYNRVAATWPPDLATTADAAKIEQFVCSAQTLVRKWLPQELVFSLESFIHDPEAPPALVIRGLPIDREIPPTGPECQALKGGRCMSETWLIGIGRIVGQVFVFSFMRAGRPGMGMIVREIYTVPGNETHVSAEGSSALLDMHIDFFQVPPQIFPNAIVFIGLRGDRNKEGQTLLSDNRKIYALLSPSDITTLRTQKITWSSRFSAFVIEGSEDHPKFNVFEEDLIGFQGFEATVQGSEEAVAAYRRVKKAAAEVVEGVWLGSGDMLLVNQKKACHGRSPYEAKYDGGDRWLQKTFVNSGGFWEAGTATWPSRTLSY